MSIRPGENWGEQSTPPRELAIFSCDRDASNHVGAALRRGDPAPAIGLTGGDLHRTLGGRAGNDLRTASSATRLQVDIGSCLIDGTIHWFLGHLVVRSRAWRGPWLVVANAAFLGQWNIAPRAHPGDGRLDILEGSLSLGDRLKARQRLPSGTHLPHPSISTRRVGHGQWEFERALTIRVDGDRPRSVRHLTARVEAAAVEVWV